MTYEQKQTINMLRRGKCWKIIHADCMRMAQTKDGHWKFVRRGVNENQASND